jgi:heptaprenyl diphosphate synthase
MSKSTKKLCALSAAVALAMILSFVESQIPPIVPIPAVKIGLANVVTVFLLYTFGWKEAGAVSLVRIGLSSILFGSPVSMLYSLSGAVLSFLLMLLFQRLKLFSAIGVSIVGGVFHNVGQIICAAFILGTATIVVYLPVLLISGVIGGIAVGSLGGLLVLKIKKYIRF